MISRRILGRQSPERERKGVGGEEAMEGRGGAAEEVMLGRRSEERRVGKECLL